ncbi:uncharacterized protein [Henckelia pumila]|uniref:uncharacterized protein n=1 Tax=Henckelia pumila TaxID=405737 RepID=UPI003C6DC57D
MDRQSGSNFISTVAAVKKYQNHQGARERKGELLCSHCGFTNHTVDKCFKLHGYPPGHYKYNQKPNQGYGIQGHRWTGTNQESGISSIANVSADDLTLNQCQQLIEFLSSKLQVGPTTPGKTRSQRLISKPIHLRDYQCYVVNHHTKSSTAHPLSSVLNDQKLSPYFCVFVSNISSIIEPQSFYQAVVLPEWRQAMTEELRALQHNLLFISHLAKLWLGVVGFTKLNFLLLALCNALAAARGWFLFQLDVNNAFLHGDLFEEVYMSLPPGYYRYGECLPKDMFANNSLFIRNHGDIFLALLVYVDDIVIATNNEKEAADFKILLNSKFCLKDLGELKYFLEIEVARSNSGISICQRHYALQLINEAGILGCKPRTTPMDINMKLSQEYGDLLADPLSYRRLIGRLLYLTITRPDLTYSVNNLSQYVSKPRVSHMEDVHNVLKYIKGTAGQSLLYSSNSNLKLSFFF